MMNVRKCNLYVSDTRILNKLTLNNETNFYKILTTMASSSFASSKVPVL